MSTVLNLTDHEHVTVISATPEALEVEARWTPAAKEPLVHHHPGQDEHFEVTEGALTVKLGDHERTFAAGASFDVPRGLAHSMAPANGEPAAARWTTSPALDTLGWFKAIDAANRAGALKPVKLGAALLAHRAEFRLGGRKAAAVK